MTALSHSPLLYALGLAIANSLWQMALLWLGYQLFFGISKKTKPTTKHLVATALLFTGFIWFMITFLTRFIELKSVQKYLVSLPAMSETEHVATQNILNWDSLLSLSEKYLPYLSTAYLIILLFLAVRLLNAFAYSHRLKTSALLPIDERWEKYVQQLALRLDIRKEVRIYLSGLIDVPATLGFVRPIILLPLATFNHLSVSQVEAVIIHEMAHIRRYDYLVNLLVASMETILFFNPFTQLLSGNLKKEREMCCDDFVVRLQRDPHNYAAALLSLEKMRVGSVPALAMAATGNKDQLLIRVKRILNIKSQNLNYGQKLLALIVVAGFISSLAWLSPVPPKKQILSKEEKLVNSVNQILRDTGSANKVFVVRDRDLHEKIIDLAKNKKKIEYQADNMYFKRGMNTDTVFFDGDINWDNLPQRVPQPLEGGSVMIVPPLAPQALATEPLFRRREVMNTNELFSKLSQQDPEATLLLNESQGAQHYKADMNAANLDKLKKGLEQLNKEIAEYDLSRLAYNEKRPETEYVKGKIQKEVQEQMNKSWSDVDKIYKEQKAREEEFNMQYLFDLKNSGWKYENHTPFMNMDTMAKKMMRKVIFPRKERSESVSPHAEEMWQFFYSEEDKARERKEKDADRKSNRKRQAPVAYTISSPNVQLTPVPGFAITGGSDALAPVTVTGRANFSTFATTSPRISVNGLSLVESRKPRSKDKPKENKTIIRIITDKGTFDVELSGDEDDEKNSPEGE